MSSPKSSENEKGKKAGTKASVNKKDKTTSARAPRAVKEFDMVDWSAEEDATIRKMRRDGNQFRTIAEELNTTAPAVRERFTYLKALDKWELKKRNAENQMKAKFYAAQIATLNATLNAAQND